MLWQGFLTACTGIIPKWKRNRLIIVLAAGAMICLPASPAKGEGSLTEKERILAEITQEDLEEISYIVDFFDYNGEFLDSRICGYGDKLEDVRVPEREEDEEYTYRFTGWEPELCETVTESAVYVAVYEKIPKDGTDPIEDEKPSNFYEGIAPEETHPKGRKQISAISYDVVPVEVGKTEEVPEETPPEVPTPVATEPPAETPAEKPAETPAEKPAETPERISEEIPQEAPGEKPTETPGGLQRRPGGAGASLGSGSGNIHISRGNMGKAEEWINAEAGLMALERETPVDQEKRMPGEDEERRQAKSGVRENRKSSEVRMAAKEETKGGKRTEASEAPKTRQASPGAREPVSDGKIPSFAVVLTILFGGAVGIIRKGRL